MHVVVVDPMRPGHETTFHPGEANLRMADIVVVNKVDAAAREDVDRVLADVAAANPAAVVVEAASPVTLAPGPDLVGARVLVVEDGPTITHGGMPHGAGMVAARKAGATDLIDPRPHAVGSLAATFAQYPGIGAVLPAMGYGRDQVRDLEATIRASGCDVVVNGTPVDLARLVDLACPVRRATYELQDLGAPRLADVLAAHVGRWRDARLRT